MFSTTATSITVEWQPPRYTNGSEVIQYDMQYAISPLDDMHDQSMASLQEMEWVRVFHKIYVTRVARGNGDEYNPGGQSHFSITTKSDVRSCLHSSDDEPPRPKPQEDDTNPTYMLPLDTTRYTTFGLTPYTYYFFRIRALVKLQICHVTQNSIDHLSHHHILCNDLFLQLGSGAPER